MCPYILYETCDRENIETMGQLWRKGREKEREKERKKEISKKKVEKPHC